jgi:hypothetical protein
MTKTLTATYESKAALANAVDDLINDGLPRESIYSDEKAMQVKVLIPDAAEPEISSILARHNPNETH